MKSPAERSVCSHDCLVIAAAMCLFVITPFVSFEVRLKLMVSSMIADKGKVLH